MLILIHLIFYIFICSLQSLTKNVYGVEGSSKGFNLKQLDFKYNEDGQTLSINRDKRYLPGGRGDGGGDGWAGCSGPECSRGYCLNGHDCICRPCPRPRPSYHWRRPQIRRPYYRRPRPRHYKRRRPYWWLRRYVVIEY
ncbi:unnamed protein product [Meloidogyne enterolobii]|uniref:Uncharacterized protein n=1 Tax=Meloidogyne enterolobii TaxID=390850 RepID=A0ACB0YGI4_MELEN